MRTARDAIQALPKPARERLRRHECGLCEIRLHSGFCGAIGPACTTYLLSERKTPFEPASLTGAIQRWAVEAWLEGRDRLGRPLGTHGLRKAFAVRMAEADCSTVEIADWLGITPAVAQVYIRARDRAKSTDRVAGKLGEATTNIVRFPQQKQAIE